jgi:hypothetical protein
VGGAFRTAGMAHGTHFTDTTTGADFLCEGLKMAGTFKSGSGLADPLGQITAATGGSSVTLLCGSPSTAEFLMTFSHYPMEINAVSFDASTGVTTGVITGIHLTLATASGAPACTATVDGTGPAADNGKVHFGYFNTGGELHFNAGGNLHAYNVSGCGGLIHSGDAITYRARTFPLPISSTFPNTITSP